MWKFLDTPRNRWFLAISYVFFIYLTLGVVRIPVQFLRDLGMLRFTLMGLYMGCSGLILYQVYLRQSRSYKTYALLLIVFILYALISKKLESPEEQIHFIEYGLVGVLFARALKTKFPFVWTHMGLALLLGSAAGWLDEIIQGILPNRHYDIRDIWLNILSVFLGLVIYVLIPRKSASQLINPYK